MNEKTKDLARLLLEEGCFTLSKTGNMRSISGGYAHPKQAVKKYIDSLSGMRLMELGKEYPFLIERMDETIEIITKMFVKHLDKKNKVVLPQSETNLYSKMEQTIKATRNERNWFIIKDIQRSGLVDSHIIVDQATAKVVDITLDGYLALVGAKLEEAPVVAGMFKYDPYRIDRFWEDEDLRVICLNSYQPPIWRQGEQLTNVKQPEIFSKFMKHVFPDAKVRSAIYDWMFWAVFFRAETHLVLNGAKGLGKGRFTAMLSALVGKVNYAEANESLFTKEFNSVVSKKRLIICDEIKVDKKAHTKLKKMANDEMSLEGKGEDMRTEDTYQSFIIQNNDESDMYAEGDDRRFFIPELGTKGLIQEFGQDWVDAFSEELKEDSQSIRKLGFWLLERGSKTAKHHVYKGPKFHRHVFISLYEWQKFILTSLLGKVDEVYAQYAEDRYISLKTLKAAYDRLESRSSRFPSNTSKIEDFLKSYYWKNEELVATVEEDEDYGLIIVPTEEFIKCENVFKGKQVVEFDEVDELDL